MTMILLDIAICLALFGIALGWLIRWATERRLPPRVPASVLCPPRPEARPYWANWRPEHVRVLAARKQR